MLKDISGPWIAPGEFQFCSAGLHLGRGKWKGECPICLAPKKRDGHKYRREYAKNLAEEQLVRVERLHLALQRMIAGVVPMFWVNPMDIYCEHCGDTKSVVPAFENDGVMWCAACAHANNFIHDEQFGIINGAQSHRPG